MIAAARPGPEGTASPAMQKARAASTWLLPPLFCLTLYWYGLWCWFRQDDFAWLQLSGHVHGWSDFWRVMFAPMAEGTIRPWSERGFFMALYTLFGFSALPFRICVFLTQFANLTLIRAIAQRLTGSAAAGVWAALLWTANSALIVAMTWSSAYNQVLCGFFLLLAFYFLLRFIETGGRRFYSLQWAVFLLGFGALEINVVYPALAALYTWLLARPFFRRTLPLFLPSIAFTALHFAVAPDPVPALYQTHFDLRILKTFATYCYWARGRQRYEGSWPRILWPAGAVLLLLGLGIFALRQTRRGSRLALFFAGWFAILLAPVLPLPDHVLEYYLTLPTIGPAILGGWGLARAWRSRPIYRACAAALLLIYLSPLPENWKETRARYRFSRRIERVVRGVEEARRLHPGSVILLRDADDTLFWNGLLDRPFAVAGISDVYMAPESVGLLTPHPELGDLSSFILPQAATLAGLRARKVVVYSLAGERLRNITGVYEATAGVALRKETPRRVDVASDLLGDLLGEGWYARETNQRWMGKRASVRLGGPGRMGGRLSLSGYCPREQWGAGPLPLRVSVDGRPLPVRPIPPGTGAFEFDYELPAGLAGAESVVVSVEAGRTFTLPGETRELGVVFGVFEIR